MTTLQPFSIICLTCGSRLKVTDRSLIGTIESCPKCGAMVQITAAADLPNQPTTAPMKERLAIGPLDVVDSDAITQSAVAGFDSSPLPHLRRTVVPTVSSAALIAPPAPPETTTAKTQTTVDEAADYRHEIEAAWQSESTQRTKQLALVGLLSLFGLIAAGVVFYQFVRTWREQTTVAQTTSIEPFDNAQPDTAADERQSVPTIEPDPVPSAAETPKAKIEPLPTVQPSDPASPIPPLMPNGFELSPASESAITPTVETPAETTAQPSNTDTKPEGESTPPPMNNLPPGLLQFIPLLSMQTNDNQTGVKIQPPPTIDTVRIEDAAMEAEPTAEPNPKHKPIDVEKSLRLQSAFDNTNASLAELVLVVSQLTMVPIEIDLITLDAANIRIEAPIKTPTGWKTTRQWIDEVCSPLGLVSQTIDGRLMISASDAAIDTGIAPALQLDDFGDGAKDIFKLIEPLLLEAEPVIDTSEKVDEAVVPIVQTSLADDGLRIVPGPSLPAKMRAVFVIEAMRLMRGMPPKLERWRTSRWMGPWPSGNEAIDGATFGDWPIVQNGKGGPRLDSPRAAAGLLHSIATLNQANVLVGWYDATRQGLYPADSVMPFSREGTAGSLLDEILGEQGLQTRVCGPALWYVCSEASYDRFEVITWLPIPAGTSDQIRKRLANSLGIEDAANMPVAFDKTHIIVRCPRYLARQLPRIINP